MTQRCRIQTGKARAVYHFFHYVEGESLSTIRVFLSHLDAEALECGSCVPVPGGMRLPKFLSTTEIDFDDIEDKIIKLANLKSSGREAPLESFLAKS